MNARDRIVSEARSWVGVRFRHQGRTRSWGVDCVGLISVVAWNLGLFKYDYRGYPRDASAMDVEHHLRKAGMRAKPIADALPGDVLLLTDRIMPRHMAIYTGGQNAIHAHASARQVVERAYGSADGVVGCFAYPGVDD